MLKPCVCNNHVLHFVLFCKVTTSVDELCLFGVIVQKTAFNHFSTLCYSAPKRVISILLFGLLCLWPWFDRLLNCYRLYSTHWSLLDIRFVKKLSTYSHSRHRNQPQFFFGCSLYYRQLISSVVWVAFRTVNNTNAVVKSTKSDLLSERPVRAYMAGGVMKMGCVMKIIHAAFTSRIYLCTHFRTGRLVSKFSF